MAYFLLTTLYHVNTFFIFFIFFYFLLLVSLPFFFGLSLLCGVTLDFENLGVGGSVFTCCFSLTSCSILLRWDCVKAGEKFV